MPDQSKSHFERYLRPILASRFFTVSVLIHILVITLLGGRVLFNKYVEPPDFQSSGEGAVSSDSPPAPPQTPEETLPPQPTVAAPPPPSSTSNLTALTSVNTGVSSFSMPLPAMAPPSISKDLSAQAATQSFGHGPAVALPGQMSGRGSGREATGQKYGEKAPAEQAVIRALQWLQSQQHSDGTWGSAGFHDAFTGLALLCFLGHGETPQNSKDFAVVVTNGINAMIDEGKRTENRFGGGTSLTSQQGPYEHGISTYALAEAYSMTKDERLVPVLTQAVDYIVKGQRSDGGWAYRYDTVPDVSGSTIKSDTSVSGWQIQALKAAHLTGIPDMDKTVQPVLDLAMKNMDRVFNPKDGNFGYRKPGDHGASLTGVGVLAKLFWLGRPDATVRRGIKSIESADLNYHGLDCNLYSWYYDTQAAFQAQGGAWDWWNHRFQDQLTSCQSADGSWPPIGPTNPPPKWTGDAGGLSVRVEGDGPLYRTVLCTLMLEVYYRYLPTSKDSALGGSVEGL